MQTYPIATLEGAVLSAETPPVERNRELVRYAMLAPSSHNSQPWRFTVGEAAVRVHADPSRWLRVADADRRELYLSIGCALENLVIAARHFGFAPEVRLFPEGEDSELVAVVRTTAAAPSADPQSAALFWAIPRRHTNRRAYDGRPVDDARIRALEAVGEAGAVQVHLTADPEVRSRMDGLVARADALQFADPAWREELGAWLGSGALGTGWLTSRMAQLAVTYLDLGGTTARKDVGLLRSASALGVVTVDSAGRARQVEAGRVFERLFLLATELGLQLHPMNQVLQVAEVRREFEALLPDAWGAPQIAFRLGFAEDERQPSPRRPLDEVTG